MVGLGDGLDLTFLNPYWISHLKYFVIVGIMANLGNDNLEEEVMEETTEEENADYVLDDFDNLPVNTRFLGSTSDAVCLSWFFVLVLYCLISCDQ